MLIKNQTVIRVLLTATVLAVALILATGQPPDLNIIRSTPKILPELRQPDLCTLDTIYCEDEDITTLIKNLGCGKIALQIAKCDSQMGKQLYNPLSSAKGVYQFNNSTWAKHCTGNALNPTDNITCFLEQYPQHPYWWQECLDIIK